MILRASAQGKGIPDAGRQLGIEISLRTGEAGVPSDAWFESALVMAVFFLRGADPRGGGNVFGTANASVNPDGALLSPQDAHE